MATKDKDPCRDKAADDEPIFTLRAQDRFAPHLVRLWCTMAEAAGAHADKILEARQCAEAMDRWPSSRKKYPD